MKHISDGIFTGYQGLEFLTISDYGYWNYIIGWRFYISGHLILNQLKMVLIDLKLLAVSNYDPTDRTDL